MKNSSRGAAGRQPMVDKQREFARLIRRGVSNSEACRRLGIDRKTGNWWKNGGTVTRNGVTRIIEPIMDCVPIWIADLLPDLAVLELEDDLSPW